MDPSEIEFLGEGESIEIVPNFSSGILYLLQGDVGPFRAGLPLPGVPLWVAVHLRQRQKCRILQPGWMNPERLEEMREEEKANQFFGEMPNPHLFVVAQLLLDCAMSDISHADKIKTLLKDIWDIRQAKLRKSVDAFVQSGLLHARLDHLQLMELNAVRPLLPHALDHVRRLEKAGAEERRRASAMAANSQHNSSGLNQSTY